MRIQSAPLWRIQIFVLLQVIDNHSICAASWSEKACTCTSPLVLAQEGDCSFGYCWSTTPARRSRQASFQRSLALETTDSRAWIPQGDLYGCFSGVALCQVPPFEDQQPQARPLSWLRTSLATVHGRQLCTPSSASPTYDSLESYEFGIQCVEHAPLGLYDLAEPRCRSTAQSQETTWIQEEAQKAQRSRFTRTSSQAAAVPDASDAYDACAHAGDAVWLPLLDPCQSCPASSPTYSSCGEEGDQFRGQVQHALGCPCELHDRIAYRPSGNGQGFVGASCTSRTSHFGAGFRVRWPSSISRRSNTNGTVPNAQVLARLSCHYCSQMERVHRELQAARNGSAGSGQSGQEHVQDHQGAVRSHEGQQRSLGPGDRSLGRGGSRPQREQDRCRKGPTRNLGIHADNLRVPEGQDGDHAGGRAIQQKEEK